MNNRKRPHRDPKNPPLFPDDARRLRRDDLVNEPGVVGGATSTAEVAWHEGRPVIDRLTITRPPDTTSTPPPADHLAPPWALLSDAAAVRVLADPGGHHPVRRVPGRPTRTSSSGRPDSYAATAMRASPAEYIRRARDRGDDGQSAHPHEPQDGPHRAGKGGSLMARGPKAPRRVAGTRSRRVRPRGSERSIGTSDLSWTSTGPPERPSGPRSPACSSTRRSPASRSSRRCGAAGTRPGAHNTQTERRLGAGQGRGTADVRDDRPARQPASCQVFVTEPRTQLEPCSVATVWRFVRQTSATPTSTADPPRPFHPRPTTSLYRRRGRACRPTQTCSSVPQRRPPEFAAMVVLGAGLGLRTGGGGRTHGPPGRLVRREVDVNRPWHGKLDRVRAGEVRRVELDDPGERRGPRGARSPS